MSYFRFYPDVKTVEGMASSNVYFFGGGRVISLTKKESEILDWLEKESVESAYEQFDYDTVKHILEYFMEKGMGNLYSDQVHAETYIPHMPFELKGYLEPPTVINELTIEIGYDDRYHIAEKDKLVVFQGCNACIPSTALYRDTDSVLEAVKAALERIPKIRIEKLVLRCGNINVYLNAVREIYDIFVKNNPRGSLEVVTCYDTYDQSVLAFLEQAKASLVVCTADAGLPEHPCFFADIAELQKRIPVTVSLILLHEGENQYDVIREKIAELGISLRTTEILHSPSDKIISLPTGRDRLEQIDTEKYFFRKKNSGCLYGKIMVDCNGDIRPCLYNKNVLGNVWDGFAVVFEKELHEPYWNKSKNKVEVCKKCANRYACVDCNTMEELFSEQPRYKNLICDYDVDTGVWIEGYNQGGEKCEFSYLVSQ